MADIGRHQRVGIFGIDGIMHIRGRGLSEVKGEKMIHVKGKRHCSFCYSGVIICIES